MGSPYRPEQASGMTGGPVKRGGMTDSSIAHTLQGGTELPNAIAGMDDKFQKPGMGGHPVNGVPTSFPAPTHSYAGGMMGAHVKHNPRI